MGTVVFRNSPSCYISSVRLVQGKVLCFSICHSYYSMQFPSGTSVFRSLIIGWHKYSTPVVHKNETFLARAEFNLFIEAKSLQKYFSLPLSWFCTHASVSNSHHKFSAGRAHSLKSAI